MSVVVVRWLLEKARPVKPASAQLVLLELGSRAQDDGSNAFPSHKTIAARTGVAERTIEDNLWMLVAGGRIEHYDTRPNGLTKVWRVLMLPVFEAANLAVSGPQVLSREAAKSARDTAKSARDTAKSAGPTPPDWRPDTARLAAEHTENPPADLSHEDDVDVLRPGRERARDEGAPRRTDRDTGDLLIERVWTSALETPRYAELDREDLDGVADAFEEVPDVDGSHERAVSELEAWLRGHGALQPSGPALGDLTRILLERHAAVAAGQLPLEPRSLSSDEIARLAEEAGYPWLRRTAAG